MRKQNRLKLYFLLLSVFFSFNVKAQTYIFVSHSLSDNALKSYFQEAQEFGAKLIIRGLLNDSFKEMQQKVQELGISYDIYPELFDDYDVKVVPAIVCDTGSKVQKMSGHISLRAALEQFDSDQGAK